MGRGMMMVDTHPATQARGMAGWFDPLGMMDGYMGDPVCGDAMHGYDIWRRGIGVVSVGVAAGAVASWGPAASNCTNPIYKGGGSVGAVRTDLLGGLGTPGPS